MHCKYCSMPKGASQDEATSNSEKIRPTALAFIELRLPEGRQLVSTFLNFIAIYWKPLGSY